MFLSLVALLIKFLDLFSKKGLGLHSIYNEFSGNKNSFVMVAIISFP